jgi:hypothetical protein
MATGAGCWWMASITDPLEFLELLKGQASGWADAAISGLGRLSDDELLAFAAAYHPSVITTDAYRQALQSLLGRFEAQVSNIGEYTGIPSVAKGHTDVAVWIDDPPRSRLAVCRANYWVREREYAEKEYDGVDPGSLSFLQWVDRDMVDLTISRHEATVGTVPHVAPSDLMAQTPELVAWLLDNEGSTP